MSPPPLRFVRAVQRRLAWRAGLRGAARSGAVIAGPALLCSLAGWWFGWNLLGPLAAAAGIALTVTAAGVAWRRAPGIGTAAVTADHALGLPGLLTTATAEHVGAQPAGFAAAVATRATDAIRGRRASQVVALGRTIAREGGIALVALAVVAATAGIPTATATHRAASSAVRLDRAAALLDLARSVAAGGDDALADAIRRAGRSLAAPPSESGGAHHADALEALEQQIRRRKRRADRARQALERIDAGDLRAATQLTATGSTERSALEAAATAPPGSSAQISAIDTAVTQLESQTAAAEGAAGLVLEEAAARARTAREALPASLPGTTREIPAAGSGTGDTGGTGRAATALRSGPPLATQLAATAPRVMARPIWNAADDAIVKRYFEVNTK